MELPDLGDRCSRPDCKQLDFLPVPCTLCNLIFCKDHSSPLNHDCDKQVNNVVATKTTSESFKCSTENCTTSDTFKMLCCYCQKHFCLTHRHHECQELPKGNANKWKAPKEQFKKVKAETDKLVEEKLQAAKQSSPANRAMVNKIKLMKIKGQAFGDNKIPSVDRVFFSVHPPYREKKGSSRALFVSKTWTVGRAIDSFAKRLKVVNKNDVKDAPKLRLFLKDGGNLVTHRMDAILEDIIKENLILDGDSLILEFVEQDVIDTGNNDSISPDKYTE